MMSSFPMWSLLVTPSIFRRHDISDTLSRFCCVVFSVQVSELYNSVLSIIVSQTCSLVALLISLDVQTLFMAWKLPLASPTLLLTSSSVPSMLMLPPKYMNCPPGSTVAHTPVCEACCHPC